MSEKERGDHISNIRIKLSSIEQSSNEAISPPHKVAKKSMSNIFSFLPQSSQRQRHTSGQINELEMYLSEECEDSESDPLEYWTLNTKKFPTLGKLQKPT